MTGPGQIRGVAGVFTVDDLFAVGSAVARSWADGVGRDWTVKAGTLDWSCAHTAAHAVDTLIAPAFFLASRRTDRYPDAGWAPGPESRPEAFIEGVEIGVRILAGVVETTPADVRALLFHNFGTVAAPVDFVPRGALELVLHAHDVCAGLGVTFAPPAEACEHLRAHVADWPFWGNYWPQLRMEGDAWDDLLVSTGRQES